MRNSYREPHLGKGSLEKSEKTELCCVKSKYPASNKMLQDELRAPVRSKEKQNTKGEKTMKMTNMKKLLSLFLCVVLIAAMALLTTACDNYILNLLGYGQEEITTAETTTADNIEEAPQVPEAKTAFTFIVVDKDGNETTFHLSTDKATVGDALLAEGLIEGEPGAYGLYVKKVNGIVADYNIDQTYWAFYINGEYAFTGVDATPAEEGATYSFKVEK